MEALSLDGDFWADPLTASGTMRRLTLIRADAARWRELEHRAGELVELAFLTDPETDPGMVEELVADLLARSQDVLCVGDGALRYRDEILDGYHCEIGGDAHPSAAPLVQLAHARALREEWVNPWEVEPIYLRAPDAQINWSTREQGSTDNADPTGGVGR